MGLSDSASDRERAICNSAIVRAESAVIRFIGYDPVQRLRTEFYPLFAINANPGHVWEATSTQAILRQVSGAVSSELQLRGLPVRSITSLFIDYDGRSGSKAGSFAADTQKIEGEDFWANWDSLDDSGASLCRDGILRSYGMWPTTPGSIKLTYTSGWTLDELHGQETLVDASQLLDATLGEAVNRAKRVFVNEKTGGGSFTTGPLAKEKLGSDYEYEVAGATTAVEQTSYGGSTLSSEARELLDDFVNWGIMVTSP